MMRALAKEVGGWGDPPGNERPHVCLMPVKTRGPGETFKFLLQLLQSAAVIASFWVLKRLYCIPKMT